MGLYTNIHDNVVHIECFRAEIDINSNGCNDHKCSCRGNERYDRNMTTAVRASSWAIIVLSFSAKG